MSYVPTDSDLERLSFIKYAQHTAPATVEQPAVDMIEWGTNAASLRLFQHADGRWEAVAALGKDLLRHPLDSILTSKALFATGLLMLVRTYLDLFGPEYIYHGDRLTDASLRHEPCKAVRRPDGKCIRGRNGSMLVQFELHGRHVVLARQLQKI